MSLTLVAVEDIGEWAGAGRVPAGVTGAGAVMVNSPRGWMNASSFITKSRINKIALNTISISGASNFIRNATNNARSNYLKKENYTKKIGRDFFALNDAQQWGAGITPMVGGEPGEKRNCPCRNARIGRSAAHVRPQCGKMYRIKYIKIPKF
ncbi:hypothetical protein BJG93_35180 [Paraburkholderia sprentiae WSM5005]|uniref:Uncharacterized protein n=1 Tax=Paraburkholderia sprentiae WSM5005 TaxID=754502 RepID=A0A8F4QKN3_9BURK|nr:hypothetical protein [Paraburkholderia sprentiae]QXE07188.1 hypothetical protein BJG93_35180 [Paraburkholderia sprentiae WSM5005]